LLGDYAGGGLYLALGIVSALLEAKTSGKGQIVDAAMIDGVQSLLTHYFAFIASGRWVSERESNFFDGGAPWYNVYETKDGKHVSVAPVERKFYDQLVQADGARSCDAARPARSGNLAGTARSICRHLPHQDTRRVVRGEWRDARSASRQCLASRKPSSILTCARADSFLDVDGVLQPAPAPRFSRTPASVQRGPPIPGSNTNEILSMWGFLGCGNRGLAEERRHRLMVTRVACLCRPI
jgi:alpha-methylacyl-CoA racemase